MSAFGLVEVDQDDEFEQYSEEDKYAPRKKSKGIAQMSPKGAVTPKAQMKKMKKRQRLTTALKRTGRKPRALSVAEEKEKGSSTASHVEIVRYILEGASHRSRSPSKRLLSTRRYSSAERLPERWFKAVEENAMEECLRMTREKLAKLFTSHFISSTEEFKDRYKMIVCMREKEEISADEDQRQYRVVGSSLLKRMLKENGIATKMPIPQPSKTLEVTATAAPTLPDVNSDVHPNEIPPCGSGFYDRECSLAELRMYAHESSLSDSLNFLKVVRRKDLFLTDLFHKLLQDELLAVALSYAELSYKVTVRILRSVPDERKRLDIIKDLVENVQIIGNLNLSRPQRLVEPSLPLSSQLVESDLADGNWFEAISHCSTAHWKCRLLYQLIALCPVPEVFLASSSPFSLQQFLHCMRYGAHCQKLAFVNAGVPFGQENVRFDYFGVNVNHSHIAAMQNNTRYLFEFIQSGFDVSSLTMKPSGTRLEVDLTVRALLEKLTATHKSKVVFGEAFPELTDKVQEHLINVIGIITDWESILQSFVRDYVERKLKCDERCEVSFDLAVSPAHIVRVSSSQPNEISVRTILFGNISTPILTKIVNMVHCGKSAVVLCVYSVSVAYQPVAKSSSDGYVLPLRVLRRVAPDCSVYEASLHDVMNDRRFALIPDKKSTSESEWYFVLDSDSLSHIPTNSVPLHLAMNASPDSLFLVQFVVVTRKEFDDVATY